MVSTCLLSILLPIFFQIISAEQEVFDVQQAQGGILRRFSIETRIPQILTLAEEHDLDVWHVTNTTVDIYSPPYAPFLPKELSNLPHLSRQLPPPPVAQRIHTKIDWNLTSLQNSTFHESYHPLDEVQSFLDQLVTTFPNNTQLTSLGHTAQGREMVSLTISSGGYKGQDEKHGKKGGKKHKQKKTRPPLRDDEKLGVLVVGAQHAREWIATSTSLYLAHALLVNSSQPNSLSKLLDHFNFHFIHIPNPDGYDYTWKTDRFWYKNRQVLGPYAKCIGLDMNRNWGYKWRPYSVGQISSNSSIKPKPQPADPCSHWYPGNRAFESYEVNNMANWIKTLPNLAGFVGLRSYGQMLSSPYSFSCKRTAKDAEDQFEAALGASQALKSVHGTEFKVGNLCSTLYPAPGNMLDWMYARESIKYSYVAHLRDTGTYGFSLPAKWIRPTGEETSGLIDYLSRFIAKQNKRQF